MKQIKASKPTDEGQAFSRKQIRVIFSENRGAAMQLARSLNVTATTVSLWLRGRTTSKRIAAAAAAMAAELAASAKAA